MRNDVDDLSYDNILKFSQGIRKDIALEMVAERLPNDPEQVKLLLNVLKDLDTTALMERKNKIESEGVKSDREIADAFAMLLKQNGNQNIFQAKEPVPVPIEAPVIKPGELGDFQHVEGEMEIGINNETCDEFIKRMKNKE